MTPKWWKYLKGSRCKQMGEKLDLNDIVGLTVNGMVVTEAYRSHNNNNRASRIRLVIRCHCGQYKDNVDYYNFKKGRYVSCGCLKRQKARDLVKPNMSNIGKTFKTNEGYEVKITGYQNKNNVEIEFLCEPRYSTISTMQNIRKGQIKYPYHRSVFGVGYYGVGEYTARTNNVKNKSYVTWASMMNRCYNEGSTHNQQSYRGCSVCDDWYNYQNFARWYEDNYYEIEGEPMELDKDIVVYGNKVYSPSTCIFVPKHVNISFKYDANANVREDSINQYQDVLPPNIVNAMRRNLNAKMAEISFRKSM